jgi:preprotein translocase subunit SecG
MNADRTWKQQDEHIQLLQRNVKQLIQLAFICMIIVVILLQISSSSATSEFGVGSQATITAGTVSTITTTTVTIELLYTSLTEVFVTLDNDGIYDVTGYACVVGDNLFFNGAALPCGPLGTECVFVHNTTTSSKSFTLTGTNTEVVPRVCSNGAGYGLRLTMVPR